MDISVVMLAIIITVITTVASILYLVFKPKTDDQWKADLKYCFDLFFDTKMLRVLLEKLPPEVVHEFSAAEIYRDTVRKKLGIIYYWQPDIGQEEPYPTVTQIIYIPNKLIDLAGGDPAIANQLGNIVGAVLPTNEELLGDREEPEKVFYYIRGLKDQINQNSDFATGEVFVHGICDNNPVFKLFWERFATQETSLNELLV